MREINNPAMTKRNRPFMNGCQREIFLKRENSILRRSGCRRKLANIEREKNSQSSNFLLKTTWMMIVKQIPI